MSLADSYQRALRLPLKREFFEAIRDGTKTEEYRLYNDYWRGRIEGRTFDKIILTLGYPGSGRTDLHLVRPWRGYEVKLIRHHHLGEDAVEVFAIRVN